MDRTGGISNFKFEISNLKWRYSLPAGVVPTGMPQVERKFRIYPINDISAMLRNFIITGLFCCAASTLFSRSLQKTRYKDPVYTDIRITQNISYVSDIPDGVKPKYYRLDL